MTEVGTGSTGMIGGASPSGRRGETHLGADVGGRMDRWMFVGLCGYLLAQVFTIPVIPIGPWPLWPTMGDLIFIALLVMAIGSGTRLGRPSYPNRALARGLRILALIALTSFGVSLAQHASGGLAALREGSPISFGAFALAKLMQFIVLFRIVASVQMSRRRLAIVRNIAVCVLVGMCIMSLATFSGIVSTASLAPWLPGNPDVAGPWVHYRSGVLTGEGVGTVSYNHGSTALHITVLLGLALQLTPWSRADRGSLGAINYGLIALSATAVLVSGSRAGLAGLALFATFYVLSRPRLERTVIVGVGLIVAALVDFVLLVLEVTRYRVDIVDRQLGFLSWNSLATRADHWDVILNHLNSNPIQWVVGSGLGATAEVGTYAHMLPFQVILELGLVGLAIIGFMFMRLLGRLRRTSITGFVMFWLTAALLVTSLTQETFYPVPAFGNFLGLYLAAVALTLTAERVAAVEGTSQQLVVAGHVGQPRLAGAASGSSAVGLLHDGSSQRRGSGGLVDAG